MKLLRLLVTVSVSLVVVPNVLGSPLLYPQHCPPLSSQQGLECYDSFGGEMNCSEPTPFAGRAKCKSFYQSSTPDGVSCGHDGWTVPDFNCQILCGKVKEVGGHSLFGATIYQTVKKHFYSKICSGTLIADGFVLTSAHCVLDQRDKQLENDILLVGLGPITNETLYKVKAVEFFNESNNKGVVEADDLAIVFLVNFSLSDNVLPACLPTCGEVDAIALRDGSTAEMFPRGKEKPEKLKVMVTANCTHFHDFCAGNSGEFNGKKCPEEIGTGITVPMGDDAHFIYGILSSTANPSCNNFRTFKRVFPFINWVKAITQITSPISKALKTQLPTTTEETSQAHSQRNSHVLISKTVETVLTAEKNPTSNKEAPTLTERTSVTVKIPIAAERTPITSNLSPTTNARTPITNTTLKTTDRNGITLTEFDSTIDYDDYRVEVDHWNSNEQATFKEIPKQKQMELTNLTIVNVTIDPITLVNSLKYAKNLTKLDLRNVSLSSGFEHVEELPKIRQYIFLNLYFEKNPKNFDAYFPFYKKAKTTDIAEMSSDFDEINIDDGNRRFLLQPTRGILLVYKFNKIADKILAGPTPPSTLNFTWTILILHHVALNPDSVPGTLTHLHLSEVNFTHHGSLTQVMKKVPQLQILALHNLVNRELKLEDLPKDTLQKLRLDRVNLTFTPVAKTKCNLTSQLIFPRLTLFYWGIDVVLDEPIIDNFAQIFPKLRQMAYFDHDNVTVIQKFLALEELELLYLRIQDVKSEEGKKIMEILNFDPKKITTKTGRIIHICVERAKGKVTFKSRYLGSSDEFFEVNRKFRESFDVPDCHGFVE